MLKTIRIMSTQIKDNEHVFYEWVTVLSIEYDGEKLSVYLADGSHHDYIRYEFISFRII